MSKRKTNLMALLLLMTVQYVNASNDSLFYKKSVDLGNVKGKKRITVVFNYTNRTGRPILIERAWTSCSCTDISYPKARIEPSQRGKIYVTISLSSFKGAFRKSIIFYYKDKKPTIIKISGTTT